MGYVHTFGGHARKDSTREARRFAEVLRKAGEEVDTSLFYTASYDSPMKFWNRRNEVMYLVPQNDRWSWFQIDLQYIFIPDLILQKSEYCHFTLIFMLCCSVYYEIVKASAKPPDIWSGR